MKKCSVTKKCSQDLSVVGKDTYIWTFTIYYIYYTTYYILDQYTLTREIVAFAVTKIVTNIIVHFWLLVVCSKIITVFVP